MDKVTLLPPEKLDDGWIDPSFLPAGEDEHYIRNRQVHAPEGGWRHLTDDEIGQLVRNGNCASDWSSVMVTGEFIPRLLRNNSFHGTVRIGRVSDRVLQFHDLRLPVGITGSSIRSCDIGDDCAIHDVHCLSHYIIADRCMLFNIGEMTATDRAKFGNGVIKDGESETDRVKIEIMNEAGSRAVYPFDGMTTADAFLWARYLDDGILQERLRNITQASMDSRRGYYGTVGEGCVIKDSGIIKDARIGPCCYVEGASKLKNITVNSSEREPSRIGENAILVNGIAGYGCRIFYGCTAVRFVFGVNCNLKYGVRVVDSVIGDNSTVSCCELLNNLIFPAHEQHHNNSFLIASCLQGQTNLAAGATVGSNHNSRANDGEVLAGRGFWPGLCTSVKHPSAFASYVLLAKGAYPAEMHVSLPFSMVSNNEAEGRLELIPAFWWLYNMYALARNGEKYLSRDRRVTQVQHIEFDTFAPDSMEEALSARGLLEEWTAKAYIRSRGGDVSGIDPETLRAQGREILGGDAGLADSLEVLGEGIEKSSRKVVIRHACKAYHAYGDMIVHYAMLNVLRYLESRPGASLSSLSPLSGGERCRVWVNLGGQLVKEEDVDALRADIRSGALPDWASIHARYDGLWSRYGEDKLSHALQSLAAYYGVASLDAECWRRAIADEERILHHIDEQVYLTRRKDYLDQFRRAVCRNGEEMLASVGPLEDNSFILQTRRRTEERLNALSKLI